MKVWKEIYVECIVVRKLNYSRENVSYIVNRHRWNGTMTMWKEKKLRSNWRQIEKEERRRQRPTSGRHVDVSLTCFISHPS
jgi:hypothetical protein